MEDEYDVIVLGTGLKECILSGLLSVNKKKVLHMDRNDYYGADSASLNLDQLYAKEAAMSEEKEEKKVEVDKKLGSAKQYSVDMCPKFIMANGNMVKMLLSTKVTRYLDFKCVEGSFVQKANDKGVIKIHEVPVNAKMALASPLMGMFQKRRYKNFLVWCLDADKANNKTWDKLDLSEKDGACASSMKEVYEYWKCDVNTQNFTGHAVALYQNDNYLTDKKQTWKCIERIKLYAHSLARYEKSPYIYPVWGLGGLPEGFSRLAAVHGGVYMLRRPIKKINYDDKGTVISVETESEGTAKLAKGGKLIGDPSYFLDTIGTKSPKIRELGKVARWIMIMNDASAQAVLGKKEVVNSAQLILPANKKGHKSDIYISIMNNGLSVAPKGFSVVSVSANVYTDDPKKELQHARDLFGQNVLKDFFFVNKTYIPCNDPRKDNVFIPSSMDATTHFESATREVMNLYRLITGTAVDLTAKPEDVDKDE